MQISVVICTYNRCDSLRQTLETVCALNVPPSLSWELLVVDNNSTDATPEVCRQFLSRLPVRYLFERRQGLSAARNCGIREALGDLIVFTDDDVDVHADWLLELWRASENHPDAFYLGGKIVPEWQASPPAWLRDNATGLLRGLCVSCDHGPVSHYLGDGEEAFYGANMAFRKKVFLKGVNFREELGRNAMSALCGEETALINELRRQGMRGFYVATAMVYHRTPKSRMTERYMRKWFKGLGVTAVRTGEYEDTKRKWLGAPGYLWRQFLLHVRIFSVTRFLCPAFIWLPSEIMMARTWGAISEFRSRARRCH